MFFNSAFNCPSLEDWKTFLHSFHKDNINFLLLIVKSPSYGAGQGYVVIKFPFTSVIIVIHVVGLPPTFGILGFIVPTTSPTSTIRVYCPEVVDGIPRELIISFLPKILFNLSTEIVNCPAFFPGEKCLSITCCNPAFFDGLNLVGPFAIFILVVSNF